MALHKDESLDRLASSANVAQFVSFRPGRNQGFVQHFSRVAGHEPNHIFASAAAAIDALLRSSSDRTINIRSYSPESPRSKEFIYAIPTVEGAITALERLASDNLHLIANETIDVSDGGVSGVVQGNVVEFAPDDTPRCVEKPGVASMSFRLGLDTLTKVYGFAPQLQPLPEGRLEFSIHPRPRGWRNSHTLVWEYEAGVPGKLDPHVTWPNRFSRHIGDKAFGLLIADHIGVPVPRTLVVGRRVAPFSFGTDTGSKEVWTRTCPVEPQPGQYTTAKGWLDPFTLFAKEDPSGAVLASVISQSAVPAQYSGAAIVGADGNLVIEGRRGEGDRLMLGLDVPEPLPDSLLREITKTFRKLSDALGSVRFEWVYDGERVWIVQMHVGSTSTSQGVIVPGEASSWIEFDVRSGLEMLRKLLQELPRNAGLMVVGDVGLTSHIADLIRKSQRPARIKPR